MNMAIMKIRVIILRQMISGIIIIKTVIIVILIKRNVVFFL